MKTPRTRYLLKIWMLNDRQTFFTEPVETEVETRQ